MELPTPPFIAQYIKTRYTAFICDVTKGGGGGCAGSFDNNWETGWEWGWVDQQRIMDCPTTSLGLIVGWIERAYLS